MWKFLLIGLLILAWTVGRRRRRTSRRPDFIDVKALSEAEADVASWQDQNRWKIIKSYESGKGYSESDLVDIIAFLGAKGIRATFDKTGIGIEGGAITTFVLKVPLEDAEIAKELLAEKNS